MAEILTVSLSKLQKEHLDEMDLSPSELFQEILDEKWLIWKRNNVEVERLKEDKIRMGALIQEYASFLEINNAVSNFEAFRSTKHA